MPKANPRTKKKVSVLGTTESVTEKYFFFLIPKATREIKKKGEGTTEVCSKKGSREPNHSNMLDSAGIQPTFSWQLLFLVEDTQLYCEHVVALSQLSQFLCYSLWHLGQILDGHGKAVPVVT